MICLPISVVVAGLDLNAERRSCDLLRCYARRTAMHQGALVFSQLMAYLPLSTFRRCVAAHRGEHKVKDFSCPDQFFSMAFAQLTYRASLRDIEVNACSRQLEINALTSSHLGAASVGADWRSRSSLHMWATFEQTGPKALALVCVDHPGPAVRVGGATILDIGERTV